MKNVRRSFAFLRTIRSPIIGSWNDIYLMGEVLDTPDTMKCPNGVLVDGMDALSVLLKRFAYPCRFSDMVARIGRPWPVPQLCMITNRMMDYVFDEYSHLLAQLNQPWLSKDVFVILLLLYMTKELHSKPVGVS